MSSRKDAALALPRTGQAGNNEDFHAITRLSYDFDLRLQPDAGSIQHPLLHLTDQLRHICKGGPAPVDEEACVLFRHLRAAYGQPFQSALVDERSGKMPLRPLEGAACAGPFQRLAGPCVWPSAPAWSPESAPDRRASGQTPPPAPPLPGVLSAGCAGILVPVPHR